MSSCWDMPTCMKKGFWRRSKIFISMCRQQGTVWNTGHGLRIYGTSNPTPRVTHFLQHGHTYFSNDIPSNNPIPFDLVYASYIQTTRMYLFTQDAVQIMDQYRNFTQVELYGPVSLLGSFTETWVKDEWQQRALSRSSVITSWKKCLIETVSWSSTFQLTFYILYIPASLKNICICWE